MRERRERAREREKRERGRSIGFAAVINHREADVALLALTKACEVTRM